VDNSEETKSRHAISQSWTAVEIGADVSEHGSHAVVAGALIPINKLDKVMLD
jgi:hypothetical protein